MRLHAVGYHQITSYKYTLFSEILRGALEGTETIATEHLWRDSRAMKTPIRILLLSLYCASWSSAADLSGMAPEDVVRSISAKEVSAVLDRDVTSLNELWADDFIVNGPNNHVLQGKRAALDLVRSGVIHYSTFVREVEARVLVGDAVIEMGLETVMPVDKAPGAGRTIRRRFTNIWLKRLGYWRLTIRQATNISNENGICR